MKKILVLGGTGAMGQYAVPDLIERGYAVDVVALDERTSENPNLRYFKANVKTPGFMEELLKNGYDAIIDFMTYGVEEFRRFYSLYADTGAQYIFLSTCRVYADDKVIVRESTPRLLDVSEDKEFLSYAEREYSLFKALQENIITEGTYKNWTIVRPATTYSYGRYQLVTWEARGFISRALAGKIVLLPEQAMEAQATLSWGGDAGRQIARLVLNNKAIGETFNICSAEHHSWREIAAYYEDLIGLKYEIVDKEIYLRCKVPESQYLFSKYQLEYARMFNRVTDNSKVLAATGMLQSEMTPLYEGLKKELSAFPLHSLTAEEYSDRKMDEYLAGIH